jgi:pre-mRNA-splicing factor CWC22
LKNNLCNHVSAKDTKDPKAAAEEASKKAMKDILTSKTGGAYIPPARLRMMQEQITDKNSQAYQRLAWEALKKSITGLVNKVNLGNLGIIVRELFKENVVRGRGMLTRCIVQAQVSSPTFTHIYAALVAVINSKVTSIQML